jgi:Flp pilus assembly protein TadG
MTNRTLPPASDRGAVLVHTALALLALVAFTTFVADYGVLWLSRAQAQNSADAGALAGAITASYDDGSDLSDTGLVKTTARHVAQRNLVYGQPPDVDVATDVTFPPCPDGSSDTCIRVDVYRNQARNNPLPIFFGGLVGLSQQGIRAMAIAQIKSANATDCLKPWGVIDKWYDHYDTTAPTMPLDTWTLDDTFDKYDKKGEIDPTIVPTADEYIAPIDPANDQWGSSFHPFDANGDYTEDYGLQLALKVGDNSDFQYATGWFSNLALFDSKGGADLKYNIKHCVGTVYKVGDELPIDTEPGEKVGPNRQGVEDDADSLINQDPGAYWFDPDGAGPLPGHIEGSAYAVSPRIVAIPLVNPDIMTEVQKGGRTTVPISNIAGFFVEDWDNPNKAVIGRLVSMPGLLVEGTGGETGAFLTIIRLVR